LASRAAAEEQKGLNVAEVAAQQARVVAETELQKAEQRKNEAMLEATAVTEARKRGEAKVVEAELEQKAAVMRGEALRITEEKEGQGVQARQTAEAQGRKALASANQAEKEADAAGNRAALLAEAAGTEAKLLADAAGTRAQLLAEAEGALRKAQAFRELDEAGRFLLILEALPPVLAALGGVAENIMVPVAKAIGEGLGNVEEIRLVDLGGGNGNGQNVLRQFANMPAETMFGIGQKLKAAGLMPVLQDLGKRLGFDIESLMKKKTPDAGTSAPVADDAPPVSE